jgi:hypothetical protein
VADELKVNTWVYLRIDSVVGTSGTEGPDSESKDLSRRVIRLSRHCSFSALFLEQRCAQVCLAGDAPLSCGMMEPYQRYLNSNEMKKGIPCAQGKDARQVS